MHNIHYLVARGDNPQDAMRNAENDIEEWGNENNWRTIIGAISRKGKVFENKSDTSNHFEIKERTLQKINEDFDEKLSQPNWGWGSNPEIIKELKITMSEILATEFEPKAFRLYLQKRGKDKTGLSFYHLKNFAYTVDAMAETLAMMGKRKKFDVFKDEYRSWELDEIGVTHLSTSGKFVYCVLLDMHS